MCQEKKIVYLLLMAIEDKFTVAIHLKGSYYPRTVKPISIKDGQLECIEYGNYKTIKIDTIEVVTPSLGSTLYLILKAILLLIFLVVLGWLMYLQAKSFF